MARPGRVLANSVVMPLASGELPPGPGAPRLIPGLARQFASSAEAAPGRLPVQPAATMPEVTVSSAAYSY